MKYKVLRSFSPEFRLTQMTTSETVNAKLLDQVARDLLAMVSRLKEKMTTVTLNQEEARLHNYGLAFLGRLGRHPTVNTLFRFRLTASDVSIHEKQAIVYLVSRALETFDNENFIEEELKIWESDLKQGEKEKELQAAAMLITLLEEEALDQWPGINEHLFEILTSENTWAAPLVLSQLQKGVITNDLIRLGGAMKIESAFDIIFGLFKTISINIGKDEVKKPDKSESTISLYADSKDSHKKQAAPSPKTIIRSLAGFGPREPLVKALKDFIINALAKPEFETKNLGLLTEVITTLGGLDKQGSKGLILDLWARAWPQETTAHQVRRTALKALTPLTQKDVRRQILAALTIMAKNPGANQVVLREAADLFGRTRDAETLPLLKAIIEHPAVSDLLLKTCFQAISMITTAEAEKYLKTMAAGPNRYLAHVAAGALEYQVRQKAMWEGLKGFR